MNALAIRAIPKPTALRVHRQAIRNTSSSASRCPSLPAYPADLARPRLILALESSADDTGAAIVSSDRRILSNVVIRQDKVHETFGGIHPLEALKGHARNMPRAVRRALDEASVGIEEVDAVAVTRGPGMHGCLMVCVNAGKGIAAATGKPVIGVNHMQAHALTPLLTFPEPPTFPFLTLLCSGGHTLLLLARSVTSYKILATTQDDSIGNAYDDASKHLALPWSLHPSRSPGGALEAFAAQSPTEPAPDPSTLTPALEGFPLALRGKMEFSYAGLKSAVQRYMLRARAEVGMPMGEEQKREVARAFQRAAVGQVEEKVRLALQWWKTEGRRPGDPELGGLVVSGGVASNTYLRERLALLMTKLHRPLTPTLPEPLKLFFPPPSLCTDNAAMIAWAAHYRLALGRSDPYEIEAKAKWSLEDLERDAGDVQSVKGQGLIDGS